MLKDRTLLFIAAFSLLACLIAWGLAYTPHSCHETTWGVHSPPGAPGTRVCDPRLGHNFVFQRDTFQNWLAVLGWVIPYVLIIGLVFRRLYHQRQQLATLLFTPLASGLLWWLLVISLNRQAYSCAFGFGGFGCTSRLGEFGLQAFFGGWLIPLGAVLAVIVLMYRQRLRDQEGDDAKDTRS